MTIDRRELAGDAARADQFDHEVGAVLAAELVGAGFDDLRRPLKRGQVLHPQARDCKSFGVTPDHGGCIDDQ